jgi:glycine/serine hydroxymethyltransferase
MGHVEIQKIVHWIDEAISNLDNEDVLKRIKSNVNNLCLNFPIYSH